MLQLHPRPLSRGALDLAALGWFFSDVSNEARRKGLGLHTHRPVIEEGYFQGGKGPLGMSPPIS